MGINLTKFQSLAVNERGSSILVSAAAGSGKTRVMTERLMAYITDKKEPESIENFLIITYTRSAAAELKGRILQELSARSAQNPENRRLRHQSTLCYGAQIGTIHSFCTNILREYSHKLELSPDFHIAEEEKCTELKEKALDTVLEASYDNMDKIYGFSELVSSVGAGRDDTRLEETILDLHNKMQSHPYPISWAESQRKKLVISTFSDVSQTEHGKLLLNNSKRTVDYWCNKLDEMWFSLFEEEEENGPLIKAYGPSITETMDSLRNFGRALSQGWDKARNQLPIPFGRLGTLQKFQFEDRKKRFQSIRDDCKAAMKKLEIDFGETSDELLKDMAKTSPAMDALLTLTIDFEKVYSSEKRRLNLLDFSDLEHFAVKLLSNEATGLPTATALEISKRYTEIMVDEYQDVNAVQDLIFRCISKNESNIFMVGDVKQSIYRFRLADPSIFIEKYNNFGDIETTSPPTSRKIFLQNNFRSDKAILNGCNSVFSTIMSTELGDIDYDEKASLYPPENADYEPRGMVLAQILEIPKSNSSEESTDKNYLEALMIANNIKQLIRGKEMIYDGEMRPTHYNDIAILLRSPGSIGNSYRRALTELGIPFISDKGSGFFRSPETQIAISLLQIIDNPHRDIPLTAVLSSPLFGFTPDELSKIRTNDMTSDFFSSLQILAETDNKCSNFIQILNKYRSIASDISVHELLNSIYDTLEFQALCAASENGDAGRMNLMLLSELAAEFEELGYCGLYTFLNHLKRMEERGDEPSLPNSAGGDAVTIMSIHKSKGLEFPIVFLANSSHRFNKTDMRKPLLVHPKLGLGCKVTDLERGIEYPTIARRAIAQKLELEMLSEEMRVMYVAMTRAKQRLYITSTVSNAEELLEKYSLTEKGKLSPEILRTAQSMSDWILRVAANDDNEIGLEIVHSSDIMADKATPLYEKDERPPVDENALYHLKKNLEFVYPYKKNATLPSKVTATMLPHGEKDEEAQEIVSSRQIIFRTPNFEGMEKPMTSAEKGTATHIVMQYIDFSKTDNLSQVESEIERITQLGQLDKRQAKGVNRKAILRFFSFDVGKRIKKADNIMREMRFSLLCDASEFFEDGEGEQILLQGVVDCCIEEQGELTVIDYKTDYVTKDTVYEVAEKYRNQIRAYSIAMEKVIKKPVKGCLLCFLSSNFSVLM